MRFAPDRTSLLLSHGLAGLLLLAAAGASIYRIAAFPPDWTVGLALVTASASLCALPFFVFRMQLLLTAHYSVHPDGYLWLRFGSHEEIIPLELIEEIQSGGKIPAEFRASGPGWRDAWQRTLETEDRPDTIWLASSRDAHLLLLSFKDRRLALSPADPAGFARAVTETSAQGRYGTVRPESMEHSPLVSDFLKDPAAITLLAVGLSAIVLLGSAILTALPWLPANQAFKFDPSGLPTARGDPNRLLLLPAAGFFLWGVDAAVGGWAWRKAERTAAYFLWFLPLLLGVGLWFAAIILMQTK